MADKMITTYNSHQSPTTDDKFFMVGASEEYLINYDLLASAILDKLTTKTFSGLNNSTVISALQATSYSTVLSASTYNDKAAALAALDSYANTFGGSVRVVGYISTANSNLLGLTNTSHYFDFYVNSESYRLLVARPVNGNTIYQLAKQGGTWGSAWVQLAKQSEVDANTTAITALNSRTIPWTSYDGQIEVTIDDVSFSGISTFAKSLVDGNTGKKWLTVRVNASTSAPKVEPFYGASFALTINCSSTNYGWGWLQSDNNINQLYYGRLGAGTWTWYKVGKQDDIATNTANIATNTSNISTLNTNLTALTNRVVKTTLSTTQIYANETSTAYNNLSISDLNDYMMVLVFVVCGNIRQYLVFVNGDAEQQYMYTTEGNNKIRAGCYVDWEGGRVRIRYLSAEGAYTYQNVYFTKVVGFLKQ